MTDCKIYVALCAAHRALSEEVWHAHLRVQRVCTRAYMPFCIDFNGQCVCVCVRVCVCLCVCTFFVEKVDDSHPWLHTWLPGALSQACQGMYNQLASSAKDYCPKALRTHVLRILGPDTIVHRDFGLFQLLPLGHPNWGHDVTSLVWLDAQYASISG